MGFTIEDMLVVSQDRYKMKMIAGNGGWSNSISWLMKRICWNWWRNYLHTTPQD